MSGKPSVLILGKWLASWGDQRLGFPFIAIGADQLTGSIRPFLDVHQAVSRMLPPDISHVN